MNRLCPLVLIAATLAVAAPKPVPPAVLKILGAGGKLDDPSATAMTVAPGARVELRARVMGGQRAWCMSPQTYAPVGAHTTITMHGIDGCEYNVNTGEFNRTGTWSVTREAYTWTASGGVLTPVGNGEHATFTAPAQPGTVTVSATGTVSWHLESVAKRDVTDGPVSATLTLTVAGTPTAMTAERARELLLQRFFQQIPVGKAADEFMTNFASPGFANNVKDLVGIEGYGATACGGYQAQVLDLFDKMRQSGTADEKAIFDQFDYGPVHAYYGGHQAVVIFPKGTDWEKTGTVLDPWPNQRPEQFPIGDWKSRFPFGVAPSGVYSGLYPMTGGASYPAKSEKMPPHLAAAYNALPPAEKAKLRDLTVQQRLDYLNKLAPEKKERVAIAAHSPVKVLVTSADGKRVGTLPDGRFVYEIEGTDLDLPPEADGSRGAMFFLPYGAYDVEVRGEKPGTYGLTMAVPRIAQGESIVQYRGVATAAGAQAKLRLDPSSAARPAVTGSDGRPVTPVALSATGQPRGPAPTTGPTPGPNTPQPPGVPQPTAGGVENPPVAPPVTAPVRPAARGPLVGSAIVALGGSLPSVTVVNASTFTWSRCVVGIPGRRSWKLKSLSPAFRREIPVSEFVADGSVPDLRNEVLVTCAEGAARFPGRF